MAELDAVIVGAGQAGLGVSYFLQQDGRKHVVLERGRIGETWLSQRWDSFRLNTPNFMNVLPGLAYDGLEPDGFWSRDEYVRYLRSYVDHWHLPVRTGITVVSVEQAKGGEGFIVRTRAGGQAEESVTSRSIVIASGMLQTPKVPAVGSRMPHGITQLHTAEYRNAAALLPGAVLVVGSGQSGTQIAEELLSAGRTVYLSTSRVGRVPRRYRGRDILEWWIDMKFLDVTYASLEDKSISRAPQPQASGIGRYGHTVSLQHLARQGAVILGRLLDVNAGTVVLGDDATANVRFADGFSLRQKDGIDAYLTQAGITRPPLEDDPADVPDPQAACVSPLRLLDLGEAKVSTIIWATGLGGDLGWIRLPVFDAEGKPLHQQGVAPVRGLYFAGFPWLRSRKSGIIYGIKEDAQYIAAAIGEQLG
jgi:putative flavoprotein involved in K+ transport